MLWRNNPLASTRSCFALSKSSLCLCSAFWQVTTSSLWESHALTALWQNSRTIASFCRVSLSFSGSDPFAGYINSPSRRRLDSSRHTRRMRLSQTSRFRSLSACSIYGGTGPFRSTFDLFESHVRRANSATMGGTHEGTCRGNGPDLAVMARPADAPSWGRSLLR